MKLIIGIAGKKRSGKDTAANILKNFPGHTVKTFAFAAILKEVVSKVFLISDEELEQKEIKIERLGYSPRQLLQKFGDHFRKINPNVFIDYMDNIISSSQTDIIIITDVRFDDEVKFIKKYNSIIIGIDADERLGIIRGDNHCTEKGISKDLATYWINNNGTENSFRDKINKLKKLIKKMEFG